MSDVQLSISKDLVQPIIEAKIKSAIIEAFGDQHKIISAMVDKLMNGMVGHDGKVSTYSSDNKFKWIDAVVTNVIKEEVEKAVREQIKASAETIREEVAKHLASKKGSQIAAKALVDALTGTFSNNWRSNIKVELIPQSKD